MKERNLKRLFKKTSAVIMTRNLLNEYEVYAIQKARRRSSRRVVAVC